jgi:RNAse (barnase) inhibitor barstar
MRQHAPDALRVDVGAASSSAELHRLLAATFHFPDYYGRNWDAFDECIRDVELPARVEIVGFEALRARLPREAELLQQCVADFISESHHDITIRMA